jgi:hypothetical protein
MWDAAAHGRYGHPRHAFRPVISGKRDEFGITSLECEPASRRKRIEPDNAIAQGDVLGDGFSRVQACWTRGISLARKHSTLTVGGFYGTHRKARMNRRHI